MESEATKASLVWDPNLYAKNKSIQNGFVNEALAKLSIPPKARIIDLGCGDGEHTARIAKSIPEGGFVLGVDALPDMIDFANKKYAGSDDISFQVTDLEKDLPPVPYGDFDLAVSFNVIHWIKDQDSFLDGLSKTLKSGGRMFLLGHGSDSIQDILKIVESMMEQEKYKSYFVGFQNPLNLFTPEQYTTFLTRHNFEPIRVELVEKNVCHDGTQELRSRFHGGWRPWLNQLPSEELRHEFSDEFIAHYSAKYPADANGGIYSRSMILHVEAQRK